MTLVEIQLLMTVLESALAWDICHKHDNKKRNILNAKMFKLFENATEFTIYTTDRKGLTSYSFDLELFFSVANESNHWRQIVIKGVYDEDDVHKGSSTNYITSKPRLLRHPP
eukprot:1156432_1